MALFAAFALSAALASPITPYAATDVTPEQRVVAGTSAVSTLRASDPERGRLPWTLRISRSETGLQCSTVGQVQDSTFGLAGLDGAFRALPEANADACGEPGTLIGARVFAAKRTRDVRSVLYGVAGAGVAKVTLTVAGGKPRTVPHTADGAFLLALRGYPEDAQPVVTIRRAGGATSTFDPVGGHDTVVADPFGGRAWKLQVFGFGGPRNAKSRVNVTCVDFLTARAVPDEPNVTSTPVCGAEPSRPGAKRTSLYFAARRLSGSGPSTNFLAGHWAGHPARVAVWGIARGFKRITVHAGAFSKSTVPLINGGFLVFLPRSTRTAAVKVTVDGKHVRLDVRHGSSAQAGTGRGGCLGGDGPGRRDRARTPARRPLPAGLGPISHPRHEVRSHRRRSRRRAPVGAAAVRCGAGRGRQARAHARGREGHRAQPLRPARAPAGRDVRLDLWRRAVPQGRHRVPATAVHRAQASTLGRAARLDPRARRPGRSGRRRSASPGATCPAPRKRASPAAARRTARRRSPPARSCGSAGLARVATRRASAAAGGR